MKYRILYLLVVAALGWSTAHAQSSADSTKQSVPFSRDRFAYHVQGGLFYQAVPHLEALVPDFQRRELAMSGKFHVGDEPLIHGASYLEFGLHYHYTAFTIDARLIGEHRGQSYGVYDRYAIWVYPKYFATFDTGFMALGHRFGAAISIGNRDDIRSGEGLMFYNLDAQGANVRLSLGTFSLMFQKMADLQYGIGLNQNDGNVFSLRLDSIALPNAIGMRAEYQVSLPTGVYDRYSSRLGGVTSLRTDLSQTLSFSLSHPSGLRAYAEAGLRNIPTGDNSAWLAGLSYHTKSDRVTLNTHAEYRYYGSMFNFVFYDVPWRYTDTNGVQHIVRSSRYDRYGEFLYPIYNYERPFSQWAVFTEYQGLNVSGLTLYADLKVPIWAGIFFKGVLDWNRIAAEGEAPFVYPFFSAAFGWEPLAGISASYGLTNRTMNVTQPYPTLWLYRSVTPEAILHWNIDF